MNTDAEFSERLNLPSSIHKQEHRSRILLKIKEDFNVDNEELINFLYENMAREENPMKLRIINIFPLNDKTSKEEFEKHLREEYIPLWSTIPSLEKIEILKPSSIFPSNPWQSDKVIVVTELWASKDAFDDDIQKARENYPDEYNTGLAIMQKWREYTEPKEPIFIHCDVIDKSE